MIHASLAKRIADRVKAREAIEQDLRDIDEAIREKAGQGVYNQELQTSLRVGRTLTPAERHAIVAVMKYQGYNILSGGVYGRAIFFSWE